MNSFLAFLRAIMAPKIGANLGQIWNNRLLSYDHQNPRFPFMDHLFF